MSELILSIETSGKNCSVSLSDADNIVAEYSVYGKNQHDRLLAELTSRILNDFNIKLDEINAVAVSAGPGSFTGLRIGISFAKGLCFGGLPKLISVPTLQAIANNYIDSANLLNVSKITSVIHSHKDLYYYQYFDLNGNEISDILFLPLENIVQQLESNCLVCSSNQILNIGSPSLQFNLTASVIAKTAHKLFSNQQFTKENDFNPIYVQDFIPK